MASDNSDIAAKVGELREALALQTEKSDRMVQKASNMREAVPEVKRKTEQAIRNISRIRQAKAIAVSANFRPEAPQISEAEKESRFSSNQTQPGMNKFRRKGNTLF